jgi:hypothetical protein
LIRRKEGEMSKFIVGAILSMILITPVLPLYALNADNQRLGLTPMTGGEVGLIDNTGLRHHIVSVNGACIDTMTWCNGVPLSDFGDYLSPYDSTVNWFKPLAPCSLYAVGGVFASSGTAKLFVSRYGYTSIDSSHPWPVTDNELPGPAEWNISGTGGWEWCDFRTLPDGYVLQLPGDSLFGVGYMSDNEGKPHIYYDDYSQHPVIYPDPETGEYDYYAHWRFTYEHDGHWYFIYYYSPGQEPEPRWCPEIMMKAVVRYYDGRDFRPEVYTEQRSNTWLRENIKIMALMSDLDGWITEATLHYTVSGSGDTAEVPMQLPETKGSRYLATGYLPGPFLVGDTIIYWCTCVDNDGNSSEGLWPEEEIKFFIIKEPQNPGAQILLVGDGGVSKQRARYYEDLLDRLGYSYEPTWFTEENKGIDSSVVCKEWGAIIWFGWGCGYLPQPDGLEADHPLIRYLDNRGRLFLADQGYFWRKGLPSGEEISFEPGEFAYDYLGVQSCISDPNMQDTISLGDTTFYAVAEDDPVSGDFYYDPVELHPTCVGVANWADYTEATAQGVDIFLGAVSGSNSGTRLQSAKGFKTVFLPWCFEAIVDCGDTSTLTAQADTLMWNILYNGFGLIGVQTIGAGFVPNSFSLSQNYPNPFNPATVIRYSLLVDRSAISYQRSAVSLKIYNILGQEVRTLVDGEQAPGYYAVVWDGRDGKGREVSSGVYFCRMRTPNFEEVKRLVLLR